MASSAPLGTVLMYPNTNTGRGDVSVNATTTTTGNATATRTPSAEPGTAVGVAPGTITTNTTASAVVVPQAPDISLRQRAVAKLRMFNFHLNWDLQMTHCKPCG